MLSSQSLVPAGAGTRRYEKSRVVVWYSELARRILPRPSPTPAGDKPQRYIPLSPPLWIPAFAGITMGLRSPHKRMKMVVRWLVQLGRASGPS